ncbi:MAG: energy-coupling factor transporter transmembrane component T family protein [Candidatus Methanosuratincola sp.]|jgi:energy-coupling factor transport system permease protein|nr:energy-coupling factor transporter transmembrane component T [Candidatus Methanosuratincola sp.]
MKVFKAFEYRRGSTILHRIDPRSKLVYLILFTSLTVYFTNPVALLIIFLSFLPMVYVGKVSARWRQSLRGSLFFIVFIFIFNFAPAAYYSGNLLDAAVSAIAMSLRFLNLISVFSIFFLTTSPEDLTQSMVQLKIPYDYALTFNMAMRFVPTLSREAQYIMDAQRSRGLEMEKGNFVSRIRNYIPVLIPLIISSFRRAELVADAMESRAFGASKKRTSLYVLKMGHNDLLFVLAAVGSALVLFAVNMLL